MKQTLLMILCLTAWCSGWSQGFHGNERESRRIIDSMRKNGQIGGSWDLQIKSTDRSYNYKLRATWLTLDLHPKHK